jgi:hypothetical protein
MYPRVAVRFAGGYEIPSGRSRNFIINSEMLNMMRERCLIEVTDNIALHNNIYDVVMLSESESGNRWFFLNEWFDDDEFDKLFEV